MINGLNKLLSINKYIYSDYYNKIIIYFDLYIKFTNILMNFFLYFNFL